VTAEPTPSDPRREFFDAEYYGAQLGRRLRRRLERSGVDGLEHYLTSGWRDGLDPSSEFSTSGYLEKYPDVRAAGIDPLSHWVRSGRAEGREAVPCLSSRTIRRPELSDGLVDRRDEIVTYLSSFGIRVDPDELDAPLHGIDAGAPDWFDPSWYLSAYPDVAEAGVDPLQHFLRFGLREWRQPNPAVEMQSGDVDSPIDRTLAAQDVRGRTRRRIDHARPLAPIPASASKVVEAIRARMTDAGRTGLVVAFGHDDHRRHIGGIQLCEGLEEREFGHRGVCYVFVHPDLSLPTMSPVDHEPLVRVAIDGVALDGQYRIADLADAWVGSSAPDLDAVVVHSLLGHSPESVSAFVRSTNPGACIWWLHDQFTRCPEWRLLRNGVERCDGPPVTSLACRLCVSGTERPDHLRRLGELWSCADWVFVAPSDSAAVSARSGATAIPVEPLVVAHLELRRAAIDRPALAPASTPIRIGFIGEPRPEKGWDVFAALAAARPAGVEFVHIGSRTPVPRAAEIEFVPLGQTADTFGTALAAITASGVDAALVWPTMEEAFSFVTAEAIAAGCEIITHPDSGNAVAMAERQGRAVVVESVDALLACDLSGLLRSRRAGPTPAWEIAPDVGLTPRVLDRLRSSPEQR